MFCSVARYSSVMITEVGTRVGRASYGSSRRHLASMHFCLFLLIFGMAPHGLEMKAIVQHGEDDVQENSTEQKAFSSGRHLSW